MLRSILVLPDGSEISSGVNCIPAIQSMEYNWSINPSTNLDFEAASAATIKVSLIDTSGQSSISSGIELSYYTINDSTGERKLRGKFIVDNPSRPSRYTYTFNAYDRMTLFDVDVTTWLLSLDAWPYSMSSLLDQLCDHCGVTLADDISLINGDYMVAKFIGHITGRQLLKWFASANASFAYITPEGFLSFRDLSTPVNLSLSRKAARFNDYVTKAIEKVVVKQTEADIGVSWPVDTEGETYDVLNNPLLATSSTEDLQPYVARLANKLIGISYTPAKLTVFDPEWVCEPGILYSITDLELRTHKVFVCAVHHRGGISTITSTGTESRTSPVAINFENKLGVVQGRVAQVEASIERVSAELSTTQITVDSVQQSVAAATLESNKLTLRVADMERNTADSVKDLNDRVSSISKSVETKVDSTAVSVQIKSELQNGVSKVQTNTGYTLDDQGLSIEKSDSEMKTRITEDGMTVLRGDEETLKASSAGVDATNLRATTYLIIGDRSRFENYGGTYTGCFWIGEV